MPDKNPLYNTSGPRAVTEEDKDAMNAMMKAKLAYAEMHGNPAAKRMISPTDNPYIFDDGDTGTHHMASYGKYAIPNIQDVPPLEYTGPRIDEAIKFDREEDAKYFAKNYKNISPALRNGGAMAPNIPTWDYPSKGTPIYRDTTDAPPKKYNKGGYLERIKRMATSAKKFNNGGGTDDPPYSAYNIWKNQTQPYNKFGFANPDYNVGNFDFRTNNFRNYNPLTNSDLKIEIPQSPPTDYIFDSHGWDFKKEYGEDGTPHYYRSKAGTDEWEDLHTVKGNALAAVKALEFGDDMSYIGTDAHKKQRQYYFEEGLKDKGEWFGPIDETKRKKLIQSWYDPENKGADFIGSGEAPNVILTWAQDRDLLSKYYKHFIRNYGEENENTNLYRQLLSGKYGYNPSTKTIYRLNKMGDAGKSRIIDTSQDSSVQDVLGYFDDPEYYDKQSIEKNKPLTDYIKDRHLVHINETKEWRGHMGAYPIFAEDIYQDNLGNWVFRNQEGMEKRLTGDPVDLYNYGGRDVYMTDAEEKAYRDAMLRENNRAMWDSPIMDLPGLVFGFGAGSVLRQGIKQGTKHLTKKLLKNQGVQALKQVIKQPLLTNTLRGTKFAPYSKYMLNPAQALDVAGGVNFVNQVYDPNSITNQSIRDYRQGKGSLLNAGVNVGITTLSGLPVGANMIRSGYGNIIGGINAIRKVPQVNQFSGGLKQVLRGEATPSQLFSTSKYSRIFDSSKPGSTTGRYWYQRADSPKISGYIDKADKATDLTLTDAYASRYNVANIQNRIRRGLTDDALDIKAANRSIAELTDPRMISYMDNTPALQDPAKRKAFIEMVENQENYWNLPNYTKELGELIAAAPANKYELNLSKDLFKNIKSYDVKDWTPDYNILNDFTGTYGFGKRQALLRSQKVFDYLSKSSKLNKIYKAEKAGYDFMLTPEGTTINIPRTTTNPEDRETKSKYKL